MARSTLLGMAVPRPNPIPLRRFFAVSAIALATANCSTNPQKFAGNTGNGLDPKYGVKASPRLYNEGDAIPKGGGRRFSGKPYVVAGRTYVPKEDARGYVREGLASWYGAAFHGRMTANGEVFDRHSIAAAHPTLPLPSYVRVTNVANGYSMVVRVNDRGPYHADRVMDVSEEVARALEFHNKGTARVRVAYLGKASVAGSDDRKLLATLRTDGGPAGGRAPVMVADLGPTEEPERFARPGRAPLAFKPVPDAEEPGEAQAPGPERAAPTRAPILLARATVAVPAAVQPTAPDARAFHPAPVQAMRSPSGTTKPQMRVPPQPTRIAAAQAPAPAKASPTQSRTTIRLATAGSSTRTDLARTAASGSKQPVAMPSAAKLAMARLAVAANAPSKSVTPERGETRSGGHRPSQLAGIY